MDIVSEEEYYSTTHKKRYTCSPLSPTGLLRLDTCSSGPFHHASLASNYLSTYNIYIHSATARITYCGQTKHPIVHQAALCFPSSALHYRRNIQLAVCFFFFVVVFLSYCDWFYTPNCTLVFAPRKSPVSQNLMWTDVYKSKSNNYSLNRTRMMLIPRNVLVYVHIQTHSTCIVIIIPTFSMFLHIIR